VGAIDLIDVDVDLLKARQKRLREGLGAYHENFEFAATSYGISQGRDPNNRYYP